MVVIMQDGAIAPSKRRYETVVDRILDVVESQKILPGQALPTERELAEAFRVSRNVVRQAFGVLEERGIIRTRQGSGRFLRNTAGVVNGGTTVGPSKASLEVASIVDVLEARILIEVEVIALACERRSNEQATELLVSANQLSGWEDNLEFHAAMAAATQNFALENLVRQQATLAGELHQRERYDDPGALERMRAEHRALAAAIMARDVATARKLAYEHLNHARDLLFQSMR
jgi:GntR family transcriptional regulator, transcriptional repressor for pyruvate dehydrogenase complex